MFFEFIESFVKEYLWTTRMMQTDTAPLEKQELRSEGRSEVGRALCDK